MPSGVEMRAEILVPVIGKETSKRKIKNNNNNNTNNNKLKKKKIIKKEKIKSKEMYLLKMLKMACSYR